MTRSLARGGSMTEIVIVIVYVVLFVIFMIDGYLLFENNPTSILGKVFFSFTNTVSCLIVVAFISLFLSFFLSPFVEVIRHGEVSFLFGLVKETNDFAISFWSIFEIGAFFAVVFGVVTPWCLKREETENGIQCPVCQ